MTADAPSPDVETVLARAIHEAECEAYTHEGRNARCERSARAAAVALRGAGRPEPSGIDVDRLNREHPLDGKTP